jgi:hypothetical protein
MTGWKALTLAALIPLMSTPVQAQTVPYEWKTIPLGGGGFVDGFLYHPAAKDVLYTRTDVGGSYRFDFATDRWVPLMDGFGRDDWDCFGNLALAIDPNNADRLYATCGLYLGAGVPNARFIASQDRGRTWTKTNLPFKLGGNALGRGTGERIQVDPINGDHILLGSNRDGLWQSTDRGHSFQRVAGYPEAGVTFVLFAKGVIYAGSGTNLSEWTGSGGGGLYASRDGGKSFARVPGSPSLIPHQAALDEAGNLYVTFADGLGPHNVTNGAVYKLSPKGEWSDISPEKPAGNVTFGYAGLDYQKGVLAVSTSNRYATGDDIYVSTDGGKSWKGVGLQAQHRLDGYPWLTNYMSGHDKDAGARRNMGHWLDAVKINPFNPDELVYGTGYGVWRTRNLSALQKGETVVFDFTNANLEETVVLGLESPPAGPKVLMAAGDVGGTAFDDFSQSPSSGFFAPMNKTNQSVAFAGLKPNIIVRSTDDEATRGYISYDGSASWQPLPSVPGPIDTPDWHKVRAGRLVISASAASLVWVPEGLGAYASADMGKTWTLSKGWPTPVRGQEAIADKAKDGVFYAFDGKAGVVLISTDHGATFRPRISGLPQASNAQLRAVPDRAGDLWLASEGGLYHLTDKTQSPLKDIDAAWQVTFGKAAPGAAYPAVYMWGKVRGIEGLWRSTDIGLSWTRINTDDQRFGRMRAIAGDPREFGVLYISPDGRGTLIGRPKPAN